MSIWNAVVGSRAARWLPIFTGTLALSLIVAHPSFAAVRDLSFSGFYSDVWCLAGHCVGTTWVKWAGAAVFAAGAVASAYFSAGATLPWMTTVATAIGKSVGLSGAAATNYGLAQLGGGSLASGGLGMKGGVAVLSAMGAFTEHAAPPVLTLGQRWINEQTSPANQIDRRNLLIALPLPTVGTGPEKYAQAIETIKVAYSQLKPSDDEKAIAASTISNYKSVDAALALADSVDLSALTPKDRSSVLSGRALMALHNGDEVRALAESQRAIEELLVLAKPDNKSFADRLFSDEGKIKDLKAGVPAAVWATAAAGITKISIDDAMRAFRSVLAAEARSPLATQFVAVFLDRLQARDDPDLVKHLQDVAQAVTAKLSSDHRWTALSIVLSRSLVLSKLNQTIIEAAESGNLKDVPQAANKKWLRDRVLRAQKDYNALIPLMSNLHGTLLDRIGVDQNDHATRGETISKYLAYEPRIAQMVAKLK